MVTSRTKHRGDKSTRCWNIVHKHRVRSTVPKATCRMAVFTDTWRWKKIQHETFIDSKCTRHKLNCAKITFYKIVHFSKKNLRMWMRVMGSNPRPHCKGQAYLICELIWKRQTQIHLLLDHHSVTPLRMVTVSFIKLPLRSGANERHRIIDVILCLYSQVLLHIFPDIPAKEKHEKKKKIHWHRSKCRK